MTPNKLASILPKLSERTNLSEDVLKQIARVYYRQVQLELSSLQCLNLDLPGLGVFVLKPKALARKIDRAKILITKAEKRTTFRGRTVTKKLRVELAELEELQARYSAEQERKKSIRENRHAIIQDSLSEPESDFRGNSQQCI